jgi:L-fuconolactonase
VRWHQLEELASTVELVPALSVVLDHLGKPPVAAGLSSEAGRQWLHALQRLAKLPRVTIKLSGLAPEADPNRDVIEQVVPFLDAALEFFGAERCMYGSDWPVSAATPHRLTNRVWRETVASRVSRESDRWRVLEGTAAEFYSIHLPPRTESTTIAHE